MIDKIVKRRLLQKKTDGLSQFLYSVIEDRAHSLSPDESLKFLFALEDLIYQLEGSESVRYGGGIHTKHKHIKYHNFFINNTPGGSKVLDIGCGNGALAFDIAEKVADVSIYGIDIEQMNIEQARRAFPHQNITYVCGDALADLPAKQFDVIVLSNVLEHLDERVDFLKTIKSRYNPKKIIIRVPVFERDWRVPLKQELGVDHRLDATHYIEYRRDEFFEEMENAGLHINHYQINWGEIWSVATFDNGEMQ